MYGSWWIIIKRPIKKEDISFGNEKKYVIKLCSQIFNPSQKRVYLIDVYKNVCFLYCKYMYEKIKPLGL